MSRHLSFGRLALLVAAILFPLARASADLQLSNIYQGTVGLSVDAAGSNNTPVGALQATIPVGSTVRQAYLYAAGTPFPWYNNSPVSLADYNGAGIQLAGNPVTNFSKLVGADSQRLDIGRWFTGRADVTSLVQGLVAADPLNPLHSWSYAEGDALNNRIDGGVLVVVYDNPALQQGSVVLYDGGQNTGGETTTVNFAGPLDTTVPGFFADMSMAVSFSIGGGQHSVVDINGTRLSTATGGFDDGLGFDGALITAGGVGDSNLNPANPFSQDDPDDELYDLRPFLSNGDLSFNIFTENPTDDDNIFFLGLHVAAAVVPEPSSIALIGSSALALAAVVWRRKRAGRAA